MRSKVKAKNQNDFDRLEIIFRTGGVKVLVANRARLTYSVEGLTEDVERGIKRFVEAIEPDNQSDPQSTTDVS